MYVCVCVCVSHVILRNTMNNEIFVEGSQVLLQYNINNFILK